MTTVPVVPAFINVTLVGQLEESTSALIVIVCPAPVVLIGSVDPVICRLSPVATVTCMVLLELMPLVADTLVVPMVTVGAPTIRAPAVVVKYV
jgi:hypothetical protein